MATQKIEKPLLIIEEDINGTVSYRIFSDLYEEYSAFQIGIFLADAVRIMESKGDVDADEVASGFNAEMDKPTEGLAIRRLQ